MASPDLADGISVFRLCKSIYADLSGFGAAKFPSRWNRQGQRAIYTATTRALALTEFFVHLPKDSIPRDLALVTIRVDPKAEIVVRRSLKSGRGWFTTMGKKLSEREDEPIGLFVPSVIVPEFNLVLYPRSARFEPEFVQIQSIEPFEIDPRLLDDLSRIRQI